MLPNTRGGVAGLRRAVRDRRAELTLFRNSGRRRDRAKPAGTRPIRRPCPARRIGLVFSSFGGREKSTSVLPGYRQADRGDRQVRPDRIAATSRIAARPVRQVVLLASASPLPGRASTVAARLASKRCTTPHAAPGWPPAGWHRCRRLSKTARCTRLPTSYWLTATRSWR